MDTVLIQTSAGLPADAHVSPDMTRSFLRFLDAAETTTRNYAKALRRFFCWLADKGIRRPTPDDVVEYRDGLKAEVKPGSLHLYMTALHLFFRWTAANGYYPDIAAHVKAPRTGRSHARDNLTAAQAHLILDTAKAHRNCLSGLKQYAMLHLMLTGGLRCIEVSRADIADIRTAGNHQVLYIQGKGHAEKDDFINLTTDTAEAIRAYLSARHAKADEPLFTSDSNNNRGERMTSDAVSRTVKGAMKQCGIDSPRLTAHSTRHTAVTLARLSGNALDDVSAFARHADLSTTMIYDHAISRAGSQCEESIERAIYQAEY